MSAPRTTLAWSLQRAARLALALALALPLTACGPRNFRNTNDDLRAERLELQQRVATLEAELEQRLGQIEALRGQLHPAGEPIAGADPPVFSAVKFARYTGPIDTDGDGGDDVLRVYLHTLDQRGRMMPVAARAELRAVVISPDAEPATYHAATWAPAEFDAAYRSGFTGTHYTLEFPLDAAAPEQLTVQVTLTDAAGATHTAQQAFHVTRPPNAEP